MSTKFTPCQIQAWQILQSNQNVFLTGAAGTGKSFLLQQFFSTKNHKQYPLVASTGTAALLIGGRTFHSFFGLGIMDAEPAVIIKKAVANPQVCKRILRAQCIVIDEVSMLSGHTLATAERIAREIKDVDKPWGGLRIIAVGDFAQLPPVSPHGEQKDWAFLHPIWAETQFTSVFLHTIIRTQEALLLRILNKVRTGTVDEEVEQFLHERTVDTLQITDAVRMHPHRATVANYNQTRLSQLPGQPERIVTMYEGQELYKKALKRDCVVGEVLLLKKDALVMIRKNDTSFPYKYVNGTLATVVDIHEDTLNVRLMNGKSIELKKTSFSVMDGNGRERASAYNFPVSLAWASTIHKAQGASIDRVVLDITRLWEPGQAYTALSRAQSSDGLFIAQWDAQSIIADQDVKAFYATVHSSWQQLASGLKKDIEITVKKIPKKTKKNKSNALQTLALLQEQKTVAEISDDLGWQQKTIVGHIEKLIQDGVEVDIEYMRPDRQIFTAIEDAFAIHGTEFLKPVYLELQEQYSYDDIKIVRLFLL